MPGLKVSGDVFKFGAGAGYDITFQAMKVAAGARLHFEGGLEYCHGLDAELSA